MEFCDARRDELPQHAFARFPAPLLRSGTVVYQPVGAGFLMRASNRFKGECASVTADSIAAKERAWLEAHGVHYYDYTRLALQYAPLMFDAIHFTYYWVPCHQTFPELARLVAQLGFQHAVGRPVEVCPPGTAAASAGTASVALGQDQESTDRARDAAVKLAATITATAAKASSKTPKQSSKKASKGGGKPSQPQPAAGGAATAAESRAHERQAPPAQSVGGLETAIQQIADEYGGKKRSAALRSALRQMTARFGVGG